jgi:hypothetical protein
MVPLPAPGAVHEQVVHKHETCKIAAPHVTFTVRNQSCMVHLWSVDFAGGTLDIVLQVWRNASMPKVKQSSKRKRVTKSVPVLGAAGLTFSMVGGASAAAMPTQDVPRTPNMVPNHAITLGDEEIADVSLATFYVFDKENAGSLRGLVQ